MSECGQQASFKAFGVYALNNQLSTFPQTRNLEHQIGHRTGTPARFLAVRKSEACFVSALSPLAEVLWQFQPKHRRKIGLERIIHRFCDGGVQTWFNIRGFLGCHIIIVISDNFLNGGDFFLGCHDPQIQFRSSPAQSAFPSAPSPSESSRRGARPLAAISQQPTLRLRSPIINHQLLITSSDPPS